MASRNTSGSGGMHRPTRNTRDKITWSGKKERALVRVRSLIGLAKMKQLQETWAKLHPDGKQKGEGSNYGDGALMVMILMKLSNIEIQSFIPVGGSRLSRVRKLDKKQITKNRKRSHAMSAKSVMFFCDFMESLDLEDGFPCAHRRPKRYIVSDNVNISWTDIHKLYKEYVNSVVLLTNPDLEECKSLIVMRLTTFREYRGWLYPGYRLTRRKEDVCDSCIR